MLPWHAIDHVLLDMDGTLLDLHFDNHFWLEHVPLRYAESRELPLEQARAELMQRYKAVEGTLAWYSVDYWTEQLGLDIVMLKHEVKHLIDVHPHVVPFLDAVRGLGKQVLLVTNAHVKALELKMAETRLGGHFDHVVCSHELGFPKEQEAFWATLREAHPFDPARSLLVDDSLPVLRSARRYGIAHLVAVHSPDTRQPRKEVEDFAAIGRFNEIMPGGG